MITYCIVVNVTAVQLLDFILDFRFYLTSQEMKQNNKQLTGSIRHLPDRTVIEWEKVIIYGGPFAQNPVHIVRHEGRQREG